jgi:L-histidine Nalpha-methyltransferase
MALATSERVLVTVHNRAGQATRDREELRQALRRSPREIPSRFFYDDRGSQLFERITELPEYYQTRTEHALLRAVAGRIAALTGASELVEIGSGAATKTRVLLDAMAATGRLRLYVPVDFAEGAVRQVADELAARYPELALHGVVADFNEDLSPLPSLAAPGPDHAAATFGVRCPGSQRAARARRLVIFLGGTIGNLLPAEAHRFLANRYREMAAGDHFLLGVDLVKPVARLEAAYNDAAGVTAEFNRNILRVANQVAGGGDFDPAAFTHRAFYDPEHRWIEMRLRSERRQQVHLPALGLELDLAPGEEIRTEISAKYDRESAEALLTAAGFEKVDWFADAGRLFGLALARHP